MDPQLKQAQDLIDQANALQVRVDNLKEVIDAKLAEASRLMEKAQTRLEAEKAVMS